MFVRHKVPKLLSLLLLFSIAVSQNRKDSVSNQQRIRSSSDPVSNFFSELGDLILDVDRTIAVQNQPKIEHEANVMSQLFRPQPDYFNRIQSNYREMQKRLGRLIGNTIGLRSTYSDHELSTVSPPPENFVSTFGPDYNPFAAAAEARKEKLKQRISTESYEPKNSIPRTIDESLKAFGRLSQAIIDDIGDLSRERKLAESVGEKKDSPPSKNTEVLDTLPKSIVRSGDAWIEDSSPEDKRESMNLHEECSNEVLQDPDLEQRRQERCSLIADEERVREDLRGLMKDPKGAIEALSSKNTDTLDKFAKGIQGRSGDALVENDLTESTAENNSEKVEDHDEASADECSSDVLEDDSLENIRREKCARIAAEERLVKDLNKLLKDPLKESQKWVSFGLKSIEDQSSVLIKRSGGIEDEGSSDAFGGSYLDKQIRQLIKDHGSWILDYPLIKLWRQRDASVGSEVSTEQSSEVEHTTVEDSSETVEIEPTEFYLPASTNYGIAVQKSGDSVSVSPHESSYYRIVNQDGDVTEEEIDFVLNPESMSDIEAVEPKETNILAFTSDGVPVKLRMGPEIDNPVQYLHKVLQSAGVSLNIPVESYDDLEPVGKEVLKLGSGILTRAVLIDASDNNELKSLLKALMVSKAGGKTVF